MTERAQRLSLAVVLVVFALSSIIYSVVTPPFEASDELWHYPMVQYIAENWRLPVQDPNNVGPWRQEGSQAPLYYIIGAVATFWVDTSDMSDVRHLNPHVDNGVATPDGNTNLIVHNPDLERSPWRGTVLAVHIVRLVSVCMSTLAVFLSWLVVREVFPERPELALGAAAAQAFTPMYVFVSGAVNNDNLLVLLSTLALLMLLRLLRSDDLDGAPPTRRYVMLGIVLGLATLTKSNSAALALLTGLVVSIRSWRRHSWTEFIVGGASTAIPMVLISGWWFIRNLILYGDLTGLNLFVEILGQRDVPAGIAQLWRERSSFAAGYWGNFGGLNVPMAAWVYVVLNSLLLLSIIGLLALLCQWLIRTRGRLSTASRPLAMCVLWGAVTIGLWATWATTTWSSQGRLIFAALPVWSMLIVLGLTGWLPVRWRRWASAGYVVFLAALTLAGPFVWIRPAYALPKSLESGDVAAIPVQLQAEFGGALRLLGYDIELDQVRPGVQIGVTLYWEAIAPTDQDNTVFVHLLGEGDLLVAQRDTFPGLGKVSTTWLVPGNRWRDRYVLTVPRSAYTPDDAVIEVGVYNALDQIRLPVTIAGMDAGDQVRFGEVSIRSLPGGLPNPVAVNFGNRMELVGYDMDARVVRPGDSVTLTFYWRALQEMGFNYTVSAQFVDPEQRKAAQSDSQPQGGGGPTSMWDEEQIVEDVRVLEVFPDAVHGVYDVRLAVYLFEDDVFDHLSVIPEGGQMQADYVLLTRVRVVE
ncbi:MAG: glycosyltransferase family 39 protein [Anaerolineae bacterium]|nr:glycosyltransferase family 39 protein [Anaerolineae bacterium]